MNKFLRVICFLGAGFLVASEEQQSLLTEHRQREASSAGVAAGSSTLPAAPKKQAPLEISSESVDAYSSARGGVYFHESDWESVCWPTTGGLVRHHGWCLDDKDYGVHKTRRDCCDDCCCCCVKSSHCLVLLAVAAWETVTSPCRIAMGPPKTRHTVVSLSPITAQIALQTARTMQQQARREQRMVPAEQVTDN